jgi:hypothetical protein
MSPRIITLARYLAEKKVRNETKSLGLRATDYDPKNVSGVADALLTAAFSEKIKKGQ